jgi:hypothetical protein
MGFRAHTADPICQDWDFLNLSPDTKALETAQLWDLKIRVRDISFFIQEDFDFSMAFQTGDRID